jgi:hypothetical protein
METMHINQLVNMIGPIRVQSYQYRNYDEKLIKRQVGLVVDRIYKDNEKNQIILSGDYKGLDFRLIYGSDSLIYINYMKVKGTIKRKMVNTKPIMKRVEKKIEKPMNISEGEYLEYITFDDLPADVKKKLLLSSELPYITEHENANYCYKNNIQFDKQGNII